MKKPIFDKPKVGAQFVSFNFPNNLSWDGSSTENFIARGWNKSLHFAPT